MFTCKVQNNNGEILVLTNNESNYQVISVEGTNPPSALINLSKIAMIDGSKFNSSQLTERNLVIQIRINGNVEENRIRLYSFFKSKELCRFYYSNDSRSVYIDGYVENIEFTPFTNNEIVQISMICPNPYFKDETERIERFIKVFSGFEFPFAISESGIPFSEINNASALVINNISERETGMIIEVTFNDDCDKLQIRKLSSSESIIINHAFLQYDKVVINTNKGNKSVKLVRNGIESNLFPSMTTNSKFFQMELGDNIFDYSVDDGERNDAVEVLFKYNFNYGGV